VVFHFHVKAPVDRVLDCCMLSNLSFDMSGLGKDDDMKSMVLFCG
jgi:hypothetical protein